MSDNVDIIMDELASANARADAAEKKIAALSAEAQKTSLGHERALMKASTNADIADSARKAAERSLDTERAARLEAEARCTQLVAELRLMATAVAHVPYTLEVISRDENSDFRKLRLVPEPAKGG